MPRLPPWRARASAGRGKPYAGLCAPKPLVAAAGSFAQVAFGFPSRAPSVVEGGVPLVSVVRVAVATLLRATRRSGCLVECCVGPRRCLRCSLSRSRNGAPRKARPGDGRERCGWSAGVQVVLATAPRPARAGVGAAVTPPHNRWTGRNVAAESFPTVRRGRCCGTSGSTIFFTLHRSNTTQPVTARQSVSASEIIVRAATRVARDARGEASQEQSSAGGQSWRLCVVVGVSFRRRVVSCPPALPTPAVDAQAPSTPTGHEPGGLEGCHRLCSSSCMHARCARHAAAPASLARSLHGTACPLPRVVSPRACVAFPAGHHKHRFRGQPGTHTQPTRPR